MQQPSKREIELAQEQIDELKLEFRRKRTISIILAGLFLVLSVILATAIRLPMMAFCAFVVFVILLLRYFDANGQLHDIGLRSTKTLSPRLSILERKSTISRSTDSGISN